MADRFTLGYEGGRHKGTRFGTLWCNTESGSGDVTLSLNIDEEYDEMFKLDILQDVIGLLQQEYEVQFGKCYPKKNLKPRNMSTVDKVNRSIGLIFSPLAN